MNKNKARMNKELQKWMKESKDKINTEKKGKYSMKKPKGMCEICGEKPSKAVCIKCGRSVCKSCYFKLISVCKKCVPKEISDKWDGSSPNWEEELGVDWVD